MKMASLIIVLLMSSASGSQESQSPQAQRIVLDTPEVITLKLTPITRRVSAGVHKPLTGPFDTESKIKFALVATNTSLIPLIVRTWDPRAQNRPRLLWDNQEVPYREGLSELLTQKDNEMGDIVSIVGVTLEPNNEKRLEDIDLTDWYEPLKPGHYQLSTQHRFIQGGKWVDSASITFEVKPKDNKPQQH
jgi:hypothetical protein